MKTPIIILSLFCTLIYASESKNDFNLKVEEAVYTWHQSEYKKLPELIVPEVLKRVASIKARAFEEGIGAVMDEYADQIFDNLDALMVREHLDPETMPDLHAGFSYTLIIEYHGELDLSNGWLHDLSTVHRGGNVLVHYNTKTRHLVITVPIIFDELEFTYNYSAKIMGLGPTGGIVGRVQDIKVEVKLGFDVDKLEASLEEFYILDAGHIDFLFNGNVLVDWLVNLLTEVVTTLLKEVILLVVESDIRQAVNQVVEDINGHIAAILNP